MKKAALIALVLGVLWSGIMLQGAVLRVTNSIKDASHNHVLWCRFVLAEDQLGVLKRGLSVTVDNQALRLVRWKADARSQPIFLPSVNAYRRVYVGSFAVSLLFDRIFHTEEELAQLLAKTTVTIAGVVLCKGAVLQELELQPFVACASLGDYVSQQKPGVLTHSDIEQPQAVPTVAWVGVHRLDSEFSWIDVVTRAWELLKNIWLGLQWWLLGVICGVIVLLAVLRRRYGWVRYLLPLQGVWLQEVSRSAALCGLMVLLVYASSCMGRMITLVAMAVVLLCGMIYMLVTPPSDQLFLGRLKRVVGFAMGVFVIPCALRAYLLYYGF